METPFTQTKEYLAAHETVETKTFYKEFFLGQERVAVVACVVLSLRIGKVLYCPYGPAFLVVPSLELKNEIIKTLQTWAKQENCVFVRIEDENNFLLKTKYLVNPPAKTFVNEGVFQPRVEWWLEISKTEREILEGMHKDHRYSMRRTEKELEKKVADIVIVNENLQEHFETFYELMQETGERNGFGVYEKKYYEKVFKNIDEKKVDGFLAVVKIDNQVTGVSLVILKDKVANFVYGASSDYKRELGANIYLQYKCILESKKLGATVYNFGGITDSVNGNVYGKKSLESLTKYKKRYGGNVKFHGNFLDIPIKKLKYYLYITRKLF